MNDLERAFSAYGPQDRQQFLDSLRNLEFQDPEWLYMPVPDNPEPWQGDVIPEVEIHFTSAGGGAVQYQGEAMVLSHGCDVVPDQDPTAVLAPVWAVSAYLDRLDVTEEQRISKRANLEANRTPNLFYLPRTEDDGQDRVVDFSFGGPVSTTRIVECYEAHDPTEFTRLSDRGWYLLTGKLAYHFVREEDPEDFVRE